MKVVSYLRVSTHLQDADKFISEVDRYAKYKQLGTVQHVEETISGKKDWKTRKIYDILNDKDVKILLVPELSRLGRSTHQLLEIVEYAKSKDIEIHCIKENIIIQKCTNPATQMFITILSALSQMERDVISQRTKEALAYKKSVGIQLGRPRGISTSRLDPHMDDIKQLLLMGVKKKVIAKKFNISPTGLSIWLKKYNIKSEV